MNPDKLIEQISLAELPICDYAFLSIDEIPFSSKVRMICQNECERYGKSWACPPAVGTVEECQARAYSFSSGFLFTTMEEVADIEAFEEVLKTRKNHEKITDEIAEIIRQSTEAVLVLSTESCDICRECTYPVQACRFPEKMHPCVESFGISVASLAEEKGIAFLAGGNIVTWFSLILYR